MFLKAYIFLPILTSTFVKGISVINETEIPWDDIEREVNQTCGWKDSTLCARRKFWKNNEDTGFARCFCDEDCGKYGDCCFDAAKEAWHLGKKIDHRWKCQKLPLKDKKIDYSIYMISFCPDTWTDHEIQQKCERNRTLSDYSYVMDLPVVSFSTNITYANVYCAICNKDPQLYKIHIDLICPQNKLNCRNLLSTTTYERDLQWNYSKRYRLSTRISVSISYLQNKTFLPLSIKSRQCKKTTDDCHFNTSIYNYCSLLAYYIDQFKNPLCARCHGHKFTCNLIVVDFRVGKHESNLPLLIDFNEMHVGNGGLKTRCPIGHVYDPIYRRCMMIFCGEKFKQVDDTCEPVHNPHETSVTFSDFLMNDTCRFGLVSEFVWLDETFLFVNKTNTTYNKEKVKIINSSTLFICKDENNEHIIKWSTMQNPFSGILIISIMCLSFHILYNIYVLTLSNLPSLSLLSLSFMLLLGQLLILAINRTGNHYFCQVIAIALHYVSLSALCWLTVIFSYISRISTTNVNLTETDLKKKFKQYCTFGWLTPAVIVIAAILVDKCHFIPAYRPRYGDNLCWITEYIGLLIFFATPIVILLLANVIFFVFIVNKIFLKQLVNENFTKTQLVSYVLLYLILALLIELTCIFNLIASITASTILWCIFIIFNASQGIYIVLAFTPIIKFY